MTIKPLLINAVEDQTTNLYVSGLVSSFIMNIGYNNVIT